MKLSSMKQVGGGRSAKRLPGLPGTSQDVSAVWATSVTDAMTFVREGCAITAAGAGGALVVWKGDDGQWRCEFMQHQRTTAFETFKHIAAVAEWLKEWWPQMKR